MNDIEARMAALCRRFAASADQQAQALRTALDAGNRERMCEVAHHLAGASGIFGQPELGQHALRLEDAIDAQASDAVIALRANAVLTALDGLALPG